MSKAKDTKRKEQFLENKKRLIELSKEARKLVDMGEFGAINEALIAIYSQEDEQIEEFKTFWQWKRDGYTIRKGSKSYLIWGQKMKGEQVPEGATEAEEYEFWPLCYLFANTQVFKAETRKDKAPEPQHKKPEKVENISNIL